MPTIKDALDIIGKLTLAEQERFKAMLLGPTFVKTLNIEDFVGKERFLMVVFALCVAVSMWFVMDTVKTAHSDKS